MQIRREGDGDIALQLVAPDRIAWLQLWPHTQPGHFVRARPTLRTIAEPARVSQLLAEAVRSWAASEATAVKVASPDTYPAAGAAQAARSFGVAPQPASQTGH
jgi:hypothetical protein